MFIKLLCLLVAGLALLSSASHAAAPCPSATLEAGVIVGTTSTAPGSTVTVNQFLGVPFAAEPVRFGMPNPPSKWKKPLKTTKQAPACFQQFSYPAATRDVLMRVYDTPPPPAGESEDCLYLDVYVPDTATKNKKVMFWLYGGGSFKYGSNSLAVYDGTDLAANQDVILVAPSFRSNVFGFSNSPQIPLGQRNVGFYDQRLALDWVQRNIHAFGGDPAAVTIFGQASGASCVDNLITTMPINPPFQAAILQSGQAGVYNSVTNGTVAWDALAEKLNCSTQANVLKCVRAANATTIVSILEHSILNFTPVKDNITELQDPEIARRSGNVARVPILAGTTAQDGRVFEYGQDNTTAWLLELVGNHTKLIDAVERNYSIGSAANGWIITDDNDQISAIYTDVTYQCPMAIAVNDSLSAGIPTWRYLYNATFPDLQPLPGMEVYHGSEVPLIFGNLPSPPKPTAFETKLSKYMQDVWANFAKDPHAGPPWPQYPSVAVLGNMNRTETTVSAAELDTHCALLNTYLEYVPSS